MHEHLPGLNHRAFSPYNLLAKDEVVVIGSGDAVCRESLSSIFAEQGYTAVIAANTQELRKLFGSCKIPLLLLDIDIPDINVPALLAEIATAHPDIAVVILARLADIAVALDCIRKGAKYYLLKPFQTEDILLVTRRVLEQRLLVTEYRKNQQELDKAHFHIELLHQLSLKMNTVYLGTVELNEILQAILVGITAEEGLRFNRAFLCLFDDTGQMLKGRLAIGSETRQEAGQIWAELLEKKLDFMEIVQNIRKSALNGDTKITSLIKKLQVPVTDEDHILIRSSRERRPILVENGQADIQVNKELVELLGEDTFVIVPLFSPTKSLGVIIADHFVTHQSISKNHIKSLEIFANQASLAIEHSRLYMEMNAKIGELEHVTAELEENKDLLVESENFSALGHMAAQLVHVLRNPITSIGGAARILARKITDAKCLEFVNMIVAETARLESTLTDMFDFVSFPSVVKKCEPLYHHIRNTIFLLQPSLEKKLIKVDLDLPLPEPVLEMDGRLMRKMFLQLVRNSIEAMPDGGGLLISVAQKNGWVSVEIADTGMGIVASLQKRVKDPFFTTKTYGTGLGLTLVEKIVEAHGGNFSLQQQPSGGMKACINLPIKIVCSFGI